jgi:hypothetical protein
MSRSVANSKASQDVKTRTVAVEPAYPPLHDETTRTPVVARIRDGLLLRAVAKKPSDGTTKSHERRAR